MKQISTFNFSKRSSARLFTCHSDLIKIMKMAIAVSPVDFGIAEGHRIISRQKELFEQGKSKCDGVNIMSKHNQSPSMAVDVYPWVNGASCYDNETVSFLAGLIICCAIHLYNAGEIKHVIRWGGNWDGDGQIITDQQFDDRPHFELLKPFN